MEDFSEFKDGEPIFNLSQEVSDFTSALTILDTFGGLYHLGDL